MLVECKAVRQEPHDPHKRWFFDRNFDLFVWENDASEIVAFQLCYAKKKAEKAISWSAATGFSHMQVNTGHIHYGRHKMSPIMRANGPFRLGSVKHSFLTSASSIDHQVKEFVIDKLSYYADGRGQSKIPNS